MRAPLTRAAFIPSPRSIIEDVAELFNAATSSLTRATLAVLRRRACDSDAMNEGGDSVKRAASELIERARVTFVEAEAEPDDGCDTARADVQMVVLDSDLNGG